VNTTKFTICRIGLLIVFSVLASTAMANDKYALLVGITHYEHSRLNTPPLKYPAQDAAAIKLLLEQSGYQVTILTGKQATKQRVSQAMDQIAQRGTADDTILLGFFGHGVQYDADAYFCPYNPGPSGG
jgi:uncharacterized caspase-like protein